MEGVDKYLKKIADNTSLRPSFQVVLSGTGSRLETRFCPPLDFHAGCNYEIALCSIETYYSFPNIDDSNNAIKVSINKKYEEIVIPVGCYEIKAINVALQREIERRGGKKDAVTLTPNFNTFHCEMGLKYGTKVDFRGDNSLRSVLGFDAKIYEKAETESEHTVNIMRVNSILVHCNLIGSSYINGMLQPVIYSFFPNALPGEKIQERPSTLIYLPVTLDIIPQMTSWVTDQNSKALNLRGEKLTLTYHIRAC